MRPQLHIIAGLALLFCLDSTTAAPPSTAIIRRQDEAPSRSSQSLTRTTPAPSRSLSSTISSNVPSTIERSSESNEPESTTTSISVTPSISTSATATRSSAESTSTGAQKSESALPIPPKVTPAMGLLGVILLISGIAYTVIGIKNQWLYVFSSAAYLVGLAVTVLIIYLMNPPVSNAIQGAFFVAAFISGALFGGLALVFADITEGLGCLLGGFCLSMWLLTVKEGGLIASPTGRAIFIGVLSVAGYSLSFSHYTREYGLIVCMAFAGATITMFGIDCLSCAGWKEFWLYLWNLNPDTFPLDTNTYPLTKGIRVELAGVILLTLLGIVSQMRLWNVVKDHRKKRTEQRLQRDMNIDREEEEVGRPIHDDFSKERAQWEAIYGEKGLQQDSVIETSTTGSQKTSSIRERDVTTSSSAETAASLPKQGNNMKRGLSANKSTTVTVSVLRDDDEIQHIDSLGKPLPSKPAAIVEQEDTNVYSMPSARPSSEVNPNRTRELPRSISLKSSRHSSTAAPVVVPLPFPIPKEEAESINDDVASVNAEPEVNEGTIPDRKRFSKRLSGTSTPQALSSARDSRAETYEDVQIVPHIEHDRASSIAATLDDEFDRRSSLSDVSALRSSTGSTFGGQQGSSPTVLSEDNKSVTNPDKETTQETSVEEPSNKDEVEQEANAKPATIDASEPTTTDEPTASAALTPAKPDIRQSLTISTDPKPDQATSSLPSPTSPEIKEPSADDGEAVEKVQQVKSNASGTPSVSSRAGARLSLAKDLLPDKMSKAALTYRTNEWAKHLQLADEPELEELAEPEPLDEKTQTVDERPVPVSDEIAGIKPAKVKRSSQRISSDSSIYPGALIRANSNTSAFSKQQLPRTNSGLTMENMSRSNSQAQYAGFRSTSSPHLPNMPISPPPMASNTLMDKRESLIQNRFSSQSFQNASTPVLPSLLDQENMTLAQRKDAIQRQSAIMMQQQQQQLQQQLQQKPRQKPPSTSQKWQQSGWANNSQQIQGFDSHQPRRSADGLDQVKREDMLANWRESMRQNAATPIQETVVTTDSQRAALMDEKRRKEMRDQQRAIAAQQRESMLGNMMRSGEMLDAHREAMRRMQAAANKKAG